MEQIFSSGVWQLKSEDRLTGLYCGKLWEFIVIDGEKNTHIFFIKLSPSSTYPTTVCFMWVKESL